MKFYVESKLRNYIYIYIYIYMGLQVEIMQKKRLVNKKSTTFSKKIKTK
jgi:hypothetical protein